MAGLKAAAIAAALLTSTFAVPLAAQQPGAAPPGSAMPLEIERRFLVHGDDWRGGWMHERFCQGYLTRDDAVTVRVRRAGARAFLTIKGAARGAVRQEFEYEIPVEHAEEML